MPSSDSTRALQVAPPGDRTATQAEEPTALLPEGHQHDFPNKDEAELLAGMMVGPYSVERVLGAGGGGIVYAARHATQGHLVAVKVLRREMAAFPKMVKRFQREATAVNAIRHPHIVNIYEFGEFEGGRPFYAMELLVGTDLRQLLRRVGRLTVAETISILKPVCEALEVVHGAGIVHRDLKASNILLVGEGESRIVKLLDFGIAKLLHPEPNEAGLTEAGTVLGTFHFMAPEQVRCETPDARTDIYALGVLLFQAVTGQYPFHSPDTSVIARMHLDSPPPRPSQSAPIPVAFDAIVLRCMAKEREARYPSAAALLAALVDFERTLVGEADVPGHLVNAVGLYVQARSEAEEQDDGDDTLLEDIANIVEIAEGRLQDASFSIPFQTGSSVLGVRSLPQDTAAAEQERHRVGALARAIVSAIEARPGKDPRVHINVTVHEGCATLDETRTNVVGGEILAVDKWAPSDAVKGVYTTQVRKK